ncbi:MAG: serine/threonine protein kinase [Thaumarchaeota archaeon]|nr:serine/threonine protein kinase [Nitrososphaerota archaeon]
MQLGIETSGLSDQLIVVRRRELSKKLHGSVLCYPGNDLSSFDSRLDQLKELGVEELIFEGTSKVGKFGIIGRGCVSTVVKARMKSENEIIALKIRRADANRSDMSRDHELQSFANSFGVGPRSISASKDLFAMQFIDSIKLGKWAAKLKTRTSKKYTRSLIRNVLEQCYLLDVNGLDHGELSNPTKHVLIWKGEPKTTIIDYESASKNRRVSNLTAVAQFFFLAGWQSEKIQKILGFEKQSPHFSKSKFIAKLRKYKDAPIEKSFEDILSYVKC